MPKAFELDLRGMREFMVNPELTETLKRIVDTGADYARSIAPVGIGSDDRNEPPGAYRDSIHGEVVITGERIEGRIVAEDWKAAIIEKGGQHGNTMAPAHHVLSRTLDHTATSL